jgi:uncharacterized glyoxalase superfamily protein PhnB
VTTDSADSILNAQSVAPSMTVNDLAVSSAWYRDVLGFKIEEQHERDGALRAVGLSAGAIRVLLNQEDVAKGRDRIKGLGFSIYITTQQSVDEIAARIKATGYTLDVEPSDMPWGVRMISLRDPDGYKLVFAKPI